MKVLAILVGAALVPALAHADPPVSATIGSAKVSAVACTIDGPALAVIERAQGGLAVTGKHVYVMDGAGVVRRYRAGRGKACKLTFDRTWGERVVEGAEAAPYVGLDADSRGAVYASARGVVRIDGAAPVEVCKVSGWLHASPRSTRLWRYEWGETPTRVDLETCTETAVKLDGWAWPASQIWVVDARVAAQSGASDGSELRVFDARGQVVLTLAPPDERTYDPRRIMRCGPGFCGIDNDTLTVWDADGAHVGSASGGALLGLEMPWLLELAGGKPGMFVLLRENAYGADRAVRIVRVDGLPTP